MIKKGASLIELVIAIVVMGIAMMTLPLMLSTTQNNNTFAIQQEAILMARTQIGDIITYLWDENSMDANGIIAVLDVTNGDSSLDRVNGTVRRVGHIKGNKRRKFFNTLTYATTSLGMEITDNNTPNDIDDFDTQNKDLSSASDTNSTLGYKLSDTNMSITVAYIDDNLTQNPFDFNTSSTPSGTTNIKMITLSLTNSQLENNLTLRNFSCNIGANELLRRSF